MQPIYGAGMRKASFAGMNCSIAQSLEIVGEWWTPLIVRDALLGVRRFDDDHHECSTRRDETRDSPPLPTHRGAS